MLPEVKEFYENLLKEGNLSDDETKLLQSILAKDSVGKVVKDGIMGNRRFNQEMDKFKKDKKDFESQVSTKMKELDDLKTSLASTSTLTQKQITDLQEAKRRVEAQLVSVVQTARDKYSNGDEFLASVGLTADVISALGTSNPSITPTTQPTQPQFNKDDLIKEIEKSIGGRVDNNALAVTDFNIFLHAARDEYEELTGKKLNVQEFKAAVLEDGTGNYQKVYEEKYNIPQLKQDKARNEMKSQLEQEIRDEFEQKYATKGLPGSQIPQSDFFNAIDSAKPKDEQENAPPIGIANRGGVLSEAVQHFSKLKEKADTQAA